MNILKNIFGFGDLARDIGGAIKSNAEVFHVNETEAMRHQEQRFQAAVGQFEAEFQNPKKSIFGEIVDGINRLPRPIMAVGTIGLFAFALIAPEAFSLRMQGLQLVPDPLWWLMGAIVSFYFGARELHYVRKQKSPKIMAKSEFQPSGPELEKNKAVSKETTSIETVQTSNVSQPLKIRTNGKTGNAAIDDWVREIGKNS